MNNALNRIAAIDVGTNVIAMWIAERNGDGSVQMLEDREAIPRIGEGVHVKGTLSLEAIERALDVLSHFAKHAKEQRAEIRIAATSAVRDASNAPLFVEAAWERLGLEVEVITGEQEAKLSAIGALWNLPTGLPRARVLDIGGGSTELAQVENGIVTSLVSLPVGSVRLAERFLLSDPPSAQQTAELRTECIRVLRDLPPPLIADRSPLVATAGTATECAMLLGLGTPADRWSVHGTEVSLDAIEKLALGLGAESLEDRRNRRGAHPGRADVIPAGAMLLHEIMSQLGAAKVRISNGGLRVGLGLQAFSS